MWQHNGPLSVSDRLGGLTELDERSREVFRRLVESYLDSGEPVGSRTLSRALPMSLSPASVRNVMADLEEAGLIYAPHTSAGRLPTERGLRFFVDGLLELGALSNTEQSEIEAKVSRLGGNQRIDDLLAEASNMLSGLSHCAGLVVAPKANARIRHIEFVGLAKDKALVILVGEDGTVENRAIDIPPGLPASALTQAANYLNARFLGKTIAEVRQAMKTEIANLKTELDELTARVVEAGLATWAGNEGNEYKNLIVRGRAHLIDDNAGLEDLDRIRRLFDDLETKNELIQLLGLAEAGEGVKIFIGSENNLFSLSGSSLVVAPYKDTQENIVGVLGVIGPTRLNYARIIPMVDYTARLVGRLIS